MKGYKYICLYICIRLRMRMDCVCSALWAKKGQVRHVFSSFFVDRHVAALYISIFECLCVCVCVKRYAEESETCVLRSICYASCSVGLLCLCRSNPTCVFVVLVK